MRERAQVVAELFGMLCGVLGCVVVAASLWGATGAGSALILWSVVLIALGNADRKGGS